MTKLIYEMELVSGEMIKNDSFDFLLLAGGSDYRAYEILRIMKSEGASINKILLFDFHERTQGIDTSDV